MGIFNLNKRVLLIIGGVVLVLIIAVTLVAVSQQPKQLRGDEANTYTNAITGEESVVFPDKGPELGAQAPEALIYGIDELASRYIDYQAASVQLQVRDFVNSISGGRATVAGIVDRKITNVDSKKSRFLLFINNPETTYEVTITVENQSQQTPYVTFKEQTP